MNNIERSPLRWAGAAAGAALLAALAACGGGNSSSPAQPASVAPESAAGRAQALAAPGQAAQPGALLAALPAAALQDSTRLAQQATFGATEALLSDISSKGAATWVAEQMALNVSRYTLGKGDAVHVNQGDVFFCDKPAYAGDTCWRDWFSTEPLQWDFYRNATRQPDQLRQRVALALQQMVVVSALEVSGTYGFRYYYNNLLAGAFGNYRDVLRKVILSPVMGEYLDHVNNDKTLPNENFARELLQLFSVGTCKLQKTGVPAGTACEPNYDNEKVREYAFALTGWTYPAGGSTTYGCYPTGANCQYLGGDMVAAPALRNTAARRLLSGVVVPAGATAPQALDKVLDSLMSHPSMAPFVGRHLVQQLTSSNPSAAYMSRVSAAFEAGTFSSGGRTFGAGVRGDLAATVAAVLLDKEARTTTANRGKSGVLREPILLFTGVLRALNGQTDGAPLGWWWGEQLRQHVFRPPSVFNFYQRDYPVAGTTLVGPQFGIHNVNSALERLNYLTYLLDWNGSDPDPSVPGATPTRLNLAAWEAQAADAAVLVDNLSLLAIGRKLADAPRAKVISAVSWWTASSDSTNWRHQRVAAAAYLVYASPDYQVQR